MFGGSFNPIHNGHLHLVQTAKRCLALDEVILIPARVSPWKQQHENMASPQDRLAMCRLAAETLPYCRVDDFELEQEGVSYTISTAQHFHQCCPDAERILLMGSDMFLCFTRWYRWQEILQLLSLGVVSRETDDWEKIARQRQLLRPYGSVELCKAQAYPMSSTKIRENFKNHVDSSCYLPKKVVEYIEAHLLYTSP